MKMWSISEYELTTKRGGTNMYFPPKSIVDNLKKEYPAGTRVRLLSMDDPHMGNLQPGISTGAVSYVDDAGTIHVNWDCGSSLGIAYGEDSCEKI
jgi:hypothetical protein